MWEGGGGGFLAFLMMAVHCLNYKISVWRQGLIGVCGIGGGNLYMPFVLILFFFC